MQRELLNHSDKSSIACKKAQGLRLAKELVPRLYEASPKGPRAIKTVPRQVKMRPKTSLNLAHTS